MITRGIDGADNINLMANASMRATCKALAQQGMLTEAQAEEFMADHILIAIDGKSGWRWWWNKTFGKEDEGSRVVVAKILK